jgi:tRNA modification GTPase
VINKADQQVNLLHPANPLRISAVTKAGIDEFIDALTRMIENLIGRVDTPTITRQRHRESCAACLKALERALIAPLPELTAEDLRLSLRELGRITGRVDVEDLLDVVFRDFCIGK